MVLRLVMFDVDGTLVDSQNDIVDSMTEAFQGLGLKAPKREAILGIVGLSLDRAIAQLAPNARPGQPEALVEGYKAAYMRNRSEKGTEASSPLYPHVRSVLQALHAQDNVLMGVATGKSRRGLDKLLDGHDLRQFFITQQVADDHPSKPHPSMLMAAASETGVEAHQAVMIGDTSYDMEMARAAGMLAIGVSWGYHSREKLTEAHIVLDDIRLLPGLLDQIWGQMA
ncbi:HAD-IA family hydrolase [Pseudoprimorskyibacter insulae]|uniref:Phosphoglycolate phosphatase n=1 Tax=Pseudoprimorskyibacter insulae TaxID=1695997 RepID=A0A2R8APG9_9RHOB|nr:HAD-IA family hydrolase [Pseudoprimorskyibacter insulae]SPF77787.1 Phosphoglycolate phosphatase [Pseudoprimorskyibacter insulae]